MTPTPLDPSTEVLLQGYFEGTLTPEESQRLLTKLQSEPALVHEVLGGLRHDALLRRHFEREFSEASAGASTSKPEPAARPARLDAFAQPGRPDSRYGSRLARLLDWLLGATRDLMRWRLPIGLVTSVAILLVVGIWYFGPTMGEPMVIAVSGGVQLERVNQRGTAALVGTPLKPGDALITESNASATVTFGEERTRFELGAETTLKLTSVANGKRFNLRSGRIEVAAARQRPFAPLIITTPNAEATVVGTHFTLTATATDSRLDVLEGTVRMADNIHTNVEPVKVPAGRYAIVGAATVLAALPRTGGITREWWNGVSWISPADYLDDPRFPGQPDGRDTIESFDFGPVTTNRFGLRLHGYVHPPAPGEYEFWLAGGAASELFLSPTEQPKDKVLVATAFSPGGPRDWDAPAAGFSRRSGSMHLDAGKRYYIEAIVSAQKGDLHLSVAWQRPGVSRELLRGEFVSPFDSKK